MVGVGDVGLPSLDVFTQSSASSEYVMSLTPSTRMPSIVLWRVPSAGLTRLTVRCCRRDTKVAPLTKTTLPTERTPGLSFR